MSRTLKPALTADGFFAALGNDTRLRCLVLLEREGELCVCELTHALGIIQPVVSRHLAVLREAQIVVDRREGVWIHYRINERLPQWVREILQSTADGLAGSEPFKSDLAALRDMPNRPGASACA